MPEEYFEVAYINFDKAILHGRATAGRDEFGVRIGANVEQVLTADQKRQVQNLNFEHQIAMDRLLGSFVNRAALATPEPRSPSDGAK